jgi:hypothetical protein
LVLFTVDSLSASPLASALPKLSKGIPGAGKSAKFNLALDSSKVKRILEVKFGSFDETARERGNFSTTGVVAMNACGS